MVWGTYLEKNCPSSNGHILVLGGSKRLPRWFGALTVFGSIQPCRMVKNGPKKSAPECPVECGGQILFGQCPNVGDVKRNGSSLMSHGDLEKRAAQLPNNIITLSTISPSFLYKLRFALKHLKDFGFGRAGLEGVIQVICIISIVFLHYCHDQLIILINFDTQTLTSSSPQSPGRGWGSGGAADDAQAEGLQDGHRLWHSGHQHSMDNCCR